jgi:hypothetical protein
VKSKETYNLVHLLVCLYKNIGDFKDMWCERAGWIQLAKNRILWKAPSKPVLVP